MRHLLDIRLFSAVCIGLMLMISDSASADRNITRSCTGIYGAEIDRVNGNRTARNTESAFFAEFSGRGGCRKINRNKCRRNAMSAIFKCGTGQWRLRTSTDIPRDCTGNNIEGYAITNFDSQMTAAICNHPAVASGDEVEARVFVSSYGSTGCGGDRALGFQGASILFPVPPASRGDAEDEASTVLGSVTMTCGDRREMVAEAAPVTSTRSVSGSDRTTGSEDASSRPGTSAMSSRLTARTAVAESHSTTACHDAVQGRIAWDYNGNTSWGSSNLDRLCSGAKTSIQPAKCFEQVMHGGVSWGGGTNWQWANVLDLCEGTTNASATISCFEREKRSGWQSAIETCSN